MTKFWKLYKSRVYENCIAGLSLSDGLGFWRNKLFYTIILYLPLLAMILLIPSMIMTYFMNLIGLAVAYFIFAATILFVALYKKMHIKLRKYFFLGLLYLVAISLIFFMGEHGAGITYLFGVTVFALLILPVNAGKTTVAINFGLCCIHAYLISIGFVDYPLRENFQVISWFLISGNSILLSTMAVIFMPMLLSGLQKTINEQHELENKLLVHQRELQSSLSEKETLLAEIHHRVKNNLAVVSGMLQIQSYKETDDQFRKKLMDSTLRIKSMANIHEQLYQSKSFSNMNFDIGLKNLVKTIIETLDIDSEIQTEFDLDPVTLNINQAIPCSLIVNEVITNSIKHAFKPGEKGLISMVLKKRDHSIYLKITDDGTGLPKDMTKDDENSLGMELIMTLALQLEGIHNYKSRDTEPGTIFEIEFEISDSPGSSGG